MYLHLGQGVVVSEADIIGVFDMDNTTSSHITRKFLSDAEKYGHVISVSDDLPNSFVVCSEINSTKRLNMLENDSNNKMDNISKTKIYLSQLSSQTLMKRSETMRFE